MSCDMFLVTFPCANECFSVENNLRTHPLIEFSFVCCEYRGIEIGYFLYCRAGRKMFMKWLRYVLLERFKLL